MGEFLIVFPSFSSQLQERLHINHSPPPGALPFLPLKLFSASSASRASKDPPPRNDKASSSTILPRPLPLLPSTPRCRAPLPAFLPPLQLAAGLAL